MRLRKAKVLFRTANNWLRWVLPDQFGHVCIEFEDDGEFVLIDTGITSTYINKYKRIVMWEQHEYKVLEIELPEYPAKTVWPQGLFGCVSMVKSIVGISNIFIQTPRQLYRYLLKEESYYGRCNSQAAGKVAIGNRCGAAAGSGTEKAADAKSRK